MKFIIDKVTSIQKFGMNPISTIVIYFCDSRIMSLILHQSVNMHVHSVLE